MLMSAQYSSHASLDKVWLENRACQDVKLGDAEISKRCASRVRAEQSKSGVPANAREAERVPQVFCGVLNSILAVEISIFPLLFIRSQNNLSSLIQT